MQFFVQQIPNGSYEDNGYYYQFFLKYISTQHKLYEFQGYSLSKLKIKSHLIIYMKVNKLKVICLHWVFDLSTFNKSTIYNQKRLRK